MICIVCSKLALAQMLDSSREPRGDAHTLRWRFKTVRAIYASPVESEGIVYAGGLDSVLHAVDVETGAERWRFRTGGEIRSSVCVDGGRVFLNGGDGALYALNARTGVLLWKTPALGERKYDFADYFHSTPVLREGVLYVGSGDGNAYARRASDGAIVWKFKTDDVVHATPVIDNGKVFVGSFDGYVYALETKTGALVWKFKTVGHRFFPKGEVQGSPAAFRGMVFVGARDYNVYALDQERGFCRWNKAFTRGWGLSTTIHDSVLYIGSSDERVLMAVDPPDGRVRWSVPMEFLVFGNNAFAESLMYLGKKEEAIKYFEMAIAKDKDGVTAENSKKMIEKIKSGN